MALDDFTKKAESAEASTEGLIGTLKDLNEGAANAASKIWSLNIAFEGVKRVTPTAYLQQLRGALTDLYRVTGLSASQIIALEGAFQKASNATRYYSTTELARVVQGLNQGITAFRLFDKIGTDVAQRLAQVFPTGAHAIAASFSQVAAEMPHFAAAVRTETLNIATALDVLARGGGEATLQYVRFIQGAEEETTRMRGVVGAFDEISKNLTNTLIQLGQVGEKAFKPLINALVGLSGILNTIAPLIGVVATAIGAQLLPGLAARGATLVGGAALMPITGLFQGRRGSQEIALEPGGAGLKPTIEKAVVDALTRTGLTGRGVGGFVGTRTRQQEEEEIRKANQSVRAFATQIAGAGLQLGTLFAIQMPAMAAATAQAFRMGVIPGALALGYSFAANISVMRSVGTILQTYAESTQNASGQMTRLGVLASGAGAALSGFGAIAAGLGTVLYTVVSGVREYYRTLEESSLRLNDLRRSVSDVRDVFVGTMGTAAAQRRSGELPGATVMRGVMGAAIELARRGDITQALTYYQVAVQQARFLLQYTELRVAQEQAEVQLLDTLGASGATLGAAWEEVAQRTSEQRAILEDLLRGTDQFIATQQQAGNTLETLLQRLKDQATIVENTDRAASRALTEAINKSVLRLNLSGQLGEEELRALNNVEIESKNLLQIRDQILALNDKIVQREQLAAQFARTRAQETQVHVTRVREQFEKEKEFQETNIRILEARKNVIRDLYLPTVFLINLTAKQIEHEREVLRAARGQISALEQRISLLSQQRGKEAEVNDTIRLRARALLDVEESQARIASLLAQTRRTWMEQMTAIAVGLPTGTFVLPGTLGEMAKRGPGWFPFAVAERARGMGTFQQMFMSLALGQRMGLPEIPGLVHGRSPFEAQAQLAAQQVKQQMRTNQILENVDRKLGEPNPTHIK